MPRRLMFTITGPSCGGKSTLVDKLLTQYPDRFARVCSDTTRQPRAGELESGEYQFVSEEEFARTALAGGYCQTVRYNGVCYGTRFDHIEELFSRGLCPVRVVEPTGVTQFRKTCEQFNAELISIYVDADPELLIERWIDRMMALEGGFDRRYYAERICRTLYSEVGWIDEQRFDFYFDLRTSREEELLYALSRAATGSIPSAMIRSMSPRGQESA